MTKNLAELCSSVLWKEDLQVIFSLQIGYLAEEISQLSVDGVA